MESGYKKNKVKDEPIKEIPVSDTGQGNSILEILPIALLILDPDGKIISANQAFKNLLGIKQSSEVENKTVADLVPVKDMGAENIVLNLIGNHHPFDFEAPFLRSLDGEKIYLQCRGLPVFDPAGEVIYLLMMFTDITEHKKLEEQYRQAQRLEAIGKLAGGIAHDFNNILTVIQGNCTRLTLNMDEQEPNYENVRQIDASAKRAEALTRKLLAFSRQQLLQPKIIDLNQLILSMRNRLEQVLGGKIKLILSLNEIHGNIKVDPAQLEQVLLNLVLNARDAMPEGGKAIIETMNFILDDMYIKKRPMVKPGSYILLAVSDTGIGMDEKIQAHVFEPFFTTKEKGKGTGMGLATVYGIVKQSDGFVWTYSEPGKGTTFKIYLPRIDEVPEPVDKTISTDQRLRGYETILVVDDEKEVRELVSEMLRYYGYNVLEAPNASNALMVFEKNKESIDLILTDIVMPQMSGIEFAEQIKPHFKHDKFLFMSGYTETVLTGQELLKDPVHFLQKPFNATTLLKKVRTVLDKNNG